MTSVPSPSGVPGTNPFVPPRPSSPKAFSEVAVIGSSFGQGQVSDLALADIDADGDLDAMGAMTGPPFTSPVVLWRNLGGAFAPGVSVASGYLALTLGDVDEDGDVDLIAGGGVWLNDGTGAYVDSGQRLFGSDGGTQHMQLVDLDRDGHLDLIAAASIDDETLLVAWRGDGAGGFGELTRTRLDLHQGGLPTFALGDIDRNGELDVALATRFASPALVVYRNLGAAQFVRDDRLDLDAPKLQGREDLAFTAEDVQTADLDADGRCEVMISLRSSAGRFGVMVWSFDDDALVDGRTILEGDATCEIRDGATRDADGDGDPDYIAGGFSAGPRLFLDVFGGLIETATRTSAFSVHQLAAGDLDGDGDPDVVAASGDDVRWFRLE
jgi:hypothetical protein